MESTNKFNGNATVPEKPVDSGHRDKAESSHKSRPKSRSRHGGAGRNKAPHPEAVKPAVKEALGNLVVHEDVTLFERPLPVDKLKAPESPRPATKTVEQQLQHDVETEVVREVVKERAAELTHERTANHAQPEVKAVEANQHLLQSIDRTLDTAPEATAAQAVDAAYEAAARQYRSPVPENNYTAPEPAPRNPLYTPPVFENGISPQAAPAETPAFIPPAPDRQAAAKAEATGRKKGQKTAEHRFKPIRDSLENTVATLKGLVHRRETQIRDLAREQTESQPAVSTVGKLQEAQTMPLPNRPYDVTPLPQQPAPEQAKPEQHAASVVEAAPAQIPAPRQEKLGDIQLLQISEHIQVDGVSVRKMYESRRFDHDSLERIVTEYLRGNQNIQKVVATEINRYDRTAFDRFERLDKANQPGSSLTATANVQPVQHGTLPRPVIPAAQPYVSNQAAATPSQKPQSQSAKTTTAERAVMGLSVLFIVAAVIIIIALLTRS